MDQWSFKSLLLISTVAVTLSACSVEFADSEHPSAETDELDMTELGLSRQPSPQCSTVSGTRTDRSLAITDAGMLAPFSFERTMGSIRATAGVSSAETNLTIYRRWLATFGKCGPKVDPNGYGIECGRSAERLLARIDPFASNATIRFHPVAIMNRFDLAPADGSNCGEYRIIYAMRSTNPQVGGRALVIFEAALPNPNPSQGRAACLPVARFWQELSTDESAARRSLKLQQFFYNGGAVPGFAPVVHAAHYGLAGKRSRPRAPGQVRTNFFVNNQEWQLREFKLRRRCPDGVCRLAFEHVTVKENPAEELFGNTHSNSKAFVQNFLPQVRNLGVPDLNQLTMNIGDSFNEFESVSQRVDVQYARPGVASAETNSAITRELTNLRSSLTVTDILNRATTQTCAGCHEVSNGVRLGGGLTWPRSLGFVHVDERGTLSPALTSVFLPHRKTVLENFINSSCGG